MLVASAFVPVASIALPMQPNRVKMAAVMGSARGYVGTCSDEGSTLRACRSDSTRTIYPARLMYFPGVETRFRTVAARTRCSPALHNFYLIICKTNDIGATLGILMTSN